MSTRREFLEQAAAAGVIAAASTQVAKAAEGAGVAATQLVNANRAARNSGARIKSAIRREETLLRLGGQGDNFHMSWAADDRQLIALCDGTGWHGQTRIMYNSRLFAVTGEPQEARFEDVPGYPELPVRFGTRMKNRYYGFGTLALDGRVYQFLSTPNNVIDAGQSGNRFVGAKLIYSPDNGRTWRNQDGSTPVRWEKWEDRSRANMIFFKEDQDAFSLLTVLQMGRNYEANRDGYVYVYAPNGNTEGTMNELVMFRAPRARLLDRGAYEYFAGLRPGNDARWVKDIGARGVVHTFPRGWVNKAVHPYAWHPSVVYNAALDAYMMANWGMGSTPDGMWFGKPSYLGFWTAPKPWGPWTQIHEETAWTPGNDPAARAYQPQIAPKWIAKDGRSYWLVWTDYQVKDGAAFNQAAEKINSKLKRAAMSAEDLTQILTLMRKHLPYYAFNAQRVDLIVS